MSSSDVFAVPIGQDFLVYAPLSATAALLNRAAMSQVRDALLQRQSATGAHPQALVSTIAADEVAPPLPRAGEMAVPLFLGLIPTRGCNMACRYCDFLAPKQGKGSTTISLNIAAAAIEGYLALLDDLGQRHAEIQFFGGEPFYAAEVVHFAVDYARDRAAARDYNCRFEATTNGLYG